MDDFKQILSTTHAFKQEFVTDISKMWQSIRRQVPTTTTQEPQRTRLELDSMQRDIYLLGRLFNCLNFDYVIYGRAACCLLGLNRSVRRIEIVLSCRDEELDPIMEYLQDKSKGDFKLEEKSDSSSSYQNAKFLDYLLVDIITPAINAEVPGLLEYKVNIHDGISILDATILLKQKIIALGKSQEHVDESTYYHERTDIHFLIEYCYNRQLRLLLHNRDSNDYHSAQEGLAWSLENTFLLKAKAAYVVPKLLGNWTYY